ncbi:hypothetical protein MUG84_13065 [Paenibacillus sp. KQZ6P-2]|uniref:Uncharacterized protein n=1 Tax=Paenibacillus mangrovi TaxID=2931978 RepID=A0A9X2B5G6_9BACL|nr:hypothetical protein [Paenibacillus mangrovi]MCJ8012662.1 hypothetical protein [Paenibacillus mangrovi]
MENDVEYLLFLVNAKNGQVGAAQAKPDGRKPEPGGWNRIQIEVDDLYNHPKSNKKEELTNENEASFIRNT